jgi:3-oxoacyl-[acyl-carrier protein] reductase
MDLGLEDKVCVVTGASKGIGRATAKRLCDEGARVLFVARSAEDVAEAADACRGEWLAIDVTAADAPERIVATCAEQMGGIDVLVNNAGTSAARPLDELTDDDWNGSGRSTSSRRCGSCARRARDGRRRRRAIVNVASSAGKRPSLTNAAYSVTKAAQLSLSRVFADQYAAEACSSTRSRPARRPASCGWPTAAWPIRPRRRAGSAARRPCRSRRQGAARALRRARPRSPTSVAFLCSDRASGGDRRGWSADGGAVNIIV